MYYWLTAALALVGMEASTAPLTPVGTWIVDYQENSCVLSRRFGPPDASTELGFEPNLAHEAGRLVLALPEKDGNGVRRGKANIALQPSGKILAVQFTSAPVKDRRGVMMTVPEDDVGDFVAAKMVSIDLGRGTPILLQTGGMIGAQKALQACQDDLAKGWGVDPANKIPDSEIPNLAQWFGGDAYPFEAFQAGAHGRTVALITVNDDGKPETCRTVVTSGTAALDKAACTVAMTRGRLPKVRRDPKALPRWMLLPVNWVLPGA
jgi:TonB family protein